MVLGRLIFLSVLFTALPLPCRAEVQENTTYSFYDVTPGRSTLHKAMTAAYPFQKAGEEHHAYTNWHIDWHFDYVPGSGGLCNISKVETTLTETMTLPRLVSATSGAMQRKFDDYLPKLKFHEDGHLKIARDTAHAIDTALSAIRDVPCDNIATQANDAAQDIFARAVAAEKDYDIQTGHGKTQGAVLDQAPP